MLTGIVSETRQLKEEGSVNVFKFLQPLLLVHILSSAYWLYSVRLIIYDCFALLLLRLACYYLEYKRSLGMSAEAHLIDKINGTESRAVLSIVDRRRAMKALEI